MPFLVSDSLLANRVIGEDVCVAVTLRDEGRPAAMADFLRDGGASLTLYSESSFSSCVSKCDLLLAFEPEERAGFLACDSRPERAANLVAGSCHWPEFFKKTDNLRTVADPPPSFKLPGSVSEAWLAGLERNSWLSLRTIGSFSVLEEFDS